MGLKTAPKVAIAIVVVGSLIYGGSIFLDKREAVVQTQALQAPPPEQVQPQYAQPVAQPVAQPASAQYAPAQAPQYAPPAPPQSGLKNSDDRGMDALMGAGGK